MFPMCQPGLYWVLEIPRPIIQPFIHSLPAQVYPRHEDVEADSFPSSLASFREHLFTASCVLGSFQSFIR